MNAGHGEEREGGAGALSGGGDVPDITRPPMFLMEQDYGNSFKMSTCAPQQQVREMARMGDVTNMIHSSCLWRGVVKRPGMLRPDRDACCMDDLG